jgi:hypothetical protein
MAKTLPKGRARDTSMGSQNRLEQKPDMEQDISGYLIVGDTNLQARVQKIFGENKFSERILVG